MKKLGDAVHFLAENIKNLLLVFLGLGFLTYELIHKIKESPVDKDILIFISANLLALLAFVIGLERFIEFNRVKKLLSAIDKSIVDLREGLQQTVGVRLIEGYAQVYEEAGRICLKGEVSIKVLLMGISAPAPEEFAKRLSDHLKKRPALTYEVVLAIDKIDDDFWIKNDRRKKFYQELGVENRLLLYVLKVSKPIGFDIAIVDDRHIHLAFPPIPGWRTS